MEWAGRRVRLFTEYTPVLSRTINHYNRSNPEESMKLGIGVGNCILKKVSQGPKLGKSLKVRQCPPKSGSIKSLNNARNIQKYCQGVNR